MIEDIIVQLVDENKRTVDYDILGLINDYSKSPKCPRISKTTTLPFSIEDNPDPLWEPAFDVKEKNLFRIYPCKQCLKHIRNGKFDEGKGSKYTFSCTAHKGKVIEIGFYPNGTSQQNLSSISLE